jgi:hypothetical protein
MICGAHYHPSRKVQYTCSRACGVAFKRLGVVPAPAPRCEICGQPCQRQRKTCGEDCAAKLLESKRTVLTCQRCGKEFTGVRARWCSANCQSLAWYYAHREEASLRSLAYYYDHREEVLTKRAARKGDLSRDW